MIGIDAIEIDMTATATTDTTGIALSENGVIGSTTAIATHAFGSTTTAITVAEIAGNSETEVHRSEGVMERWVNRSITPSFQRSPKTLFPLQLDCSHCLLANSIKSEHRVFVLAAPMKSHLVRVVRIVGVLRVSKGQNGP